MSLFHSPVLGIFNGFCLQLSHYFLHPLLSGFIDYRERFCNLLQSGGVYSKPNVRVLDRIEREYTHRMMACSSMVLAKELYRQVKEMPGETTGGHFLAQYGVRVGGPLFPNGEGPLGLLEAWSSDGKPSVVKMLNHYVSFDSDKEPGGSEALACKVCQIQTH